MFGTCAYDPTAVPDSPSQVKKGGFETGGVQRKRGEEKEGRAEMGMWRLMHVHEYVLTNANRQLIIK